MLIRSQDRKILIELKNLIIEGYDSIGYKIYSCQNKVSFNMGKYSSFKNASKVLDEIQDDKCAGCAWYQMPQDNELIKK